jgi:hypothetical protein
MQAGDIPDKRLPNDEEREGQEGRRSWGVRPSKALEAVFMQS